MDVTESYKEALSVEGPWILDVCLDFFSCRDPFAGIPLNESRLTGPLPSGGCDDVEDCVKAVDAFEAALRPTASNPPAMVTVARSARRLLRRRWSTSSSGASLMPSAVCMATRASAATSAGGWRSTRAKFQGRFPRRGSGRGKF